MGSRRDGRVVVLLASCEVGKQRRAEQDQSAWIDRATDGEGSRVRTALDIKSAQVLPRRVKIARLEDR